MRWLGLALLIFAPLSSRADLLGQVNLENALQAKLLDLVSVYDNEAKVLVRVEVKTYDGNLPGSNANNLQNVAPDKIDLADVAKINVEVYTRQTVSANLRAAVLEALPIKDKSQIHLNFGTLSNTAKPLDLKPIELKPVDIKPVEIRDLGQIVSTSITSLSRNLALIVVLFLVVFVLGTHYQNSRMLNEFRVQFKALSEAVANSGGATNVPLPAQRPPSATPNVTSSDKVEKTVFEHWTGPALKELLGDIYWSELDSYAHWVWKNISGPQRATLLKALPYLKEYCDYFVEQEAVAYTFHEHPYYMEPLTLALVSQETLGSYVKKDPALWKMLSPMRKQRLSLELSEKILAIQSTAAPKLPDFISVRSAPRKFTATSVWGEVTTRDEETIFQDPSTVPVDIRHHIRSIVWLAKKDKDFVRRTLDKYDARSLASAWVGPDAVLRELELTLPEKKLKLVQNYRTKVPPSRQSEVYQLLVDEGLRAEEGVKDEAA